MFGRKKRSAGAAMASPGSSSYVPVEASSPEDDIEERLSHINDEEEWDRQHGSIVWQYNKNSLTFWVLCVCSLCFAALNGHYGYVSSQNVAGAFGAAAIATLYFAIEMTIPASAHMVSWEGRNKIIIRLSGILAMLLGIVFSLVILQSKFASGADSANARADIISKTITSDATEMAAAEKKIANLRARVGDKSPARYLEEMRAVTATPITKRETLGDVTNECQDAKRTSQQRELCARYDDLRMKREDAIALEREEKRYAELKQSLRSSGSDAVGNAAAADLVWSRITGISIEKITTFKASAIAMAAAILTHILWLAHGAGVNSTIANKREKILAKHSLIRSAGRLRSRKQEEESARLAAAAALAEETNRKFLEAKNIQHRVVQAITTAPLTEQPAAIQVQKFYTDQTILMDGMSGRVGDMHDHYSRWARDNQMNPLTVERFITVTKEIGLSVSGDGRIIGAALK